MNKKGGASLIFVLITGLVMGIGLFYQGIDTSNKVRRMCKQLDSMEGFYSSEIAAWKEYGKVVPSPLPPKKLIISDEKIRSTIRRYVEGNLLYSIGTTENCGITKFNAGPGFYKTCLIK